MKKLLIVVDAQNDFVTGSLGSKEAQKRIPNIINKIKEYENDIVLFTQDTHYDNYLETQEGRKLPIEHCKIGSWGREIVPEVLAAVEGEYKIVPKCIFGLFFALEEAGDAINEVEIVGFCTDICVVSNALILRSQYPELQITVDASCCAGTTKEKHFAALNVMESCQIEVTNKEKVFTIEEVEKILFL